MADVIAGFDIGGTKTALVVADVAEGDVYRAVEPTDAASPDLTVSRKLVTYRGLSAQLVRMLEASSGATKGGRLVAIGVVSAGPIRDGGLWDSTNIVPVRVAPADLQIPCYIPLVDPLRDAFGCPVALINDCNGAVLGEVFFGIGEDVADKSSLHLAYVTISTGFGVGVWDGGRLVLGKDGNAGELGHTVVEEEGPLCGCGNRGCVETYASGSGIVRNARDRLSSGDVGTESALVRLLTRSDTATPPPIEEISARLTSEIVFEALAQGDQLANSIIDDLIRAAGIGFSAVANAYDPSTISVGGGVALAHPELLGPIAERMRRHLNVRPPEVRLTPLGARATELGALALAKELISR